MIGDADLQIYQEANSVQNAPEVVRRVWQTAAELGYGRAFRQRGRASHHRRSHAAAQEGLHVIDVIDIQYGPLPSSHNGFTHANPNYHHTAGHDGQAVGEEPADRRRRGGDAGEVSRRRSSPRKRQLPKGAGLPNDANSPKGAELPDGRLTAERRPAELSGVNCSRAARCRR